MGFTRVLDVSDSSQITKVLYNPQNQNVVVKIKNRGSFVFTGIPITVINGLFTAPSVGTYFNTEIRNKYSGRMM